MDPDSTQTLADELHAATNHRLPEINEDLTTPDRLVPPAVPLNPATASNADGLSVMEKDAH